MRKLHKSLYPRPDLRVSGNQSSMTKRMIRKLSTSTKTRMRSTDTSILKTLETTLIKSTTIKSITVVAVRAKHCIAFCSLLQPGLLFSAPSSKSSGSTLDLLRNLISLMTAATKPREKNSANNYSKSNSSPTERPTSKLRSLQRN